CQIGKYCWGGSGFPTSGNDPDNLNSPDPDGQVLYLATARIGVINPKPKAPVLSGEPLWVTTFEFLAIGGAASTSVSFNLCTGDFPTRTRIIGDGAGNIITGNLGQATIRINECVNVVDCNDGIPCTMDTCDIQSQCQHTPVDSSCDNAVFCDGVEICDPLLGCLSPGDPCVGQELICNETPGECVECLQDTDCDDGIVCTTDTCTNDLCEHQDTCVDDDIFCNGTEFCNLSTNLCDRTGHPCPTQPCDEEAHCPGCDPPLVESVGPRYIAITPQPKVNPTPTAFLVTSSSWPCLSKYVGTFAKCGGTGGNCNVDADCNSCTLLNSACLSDADCKTCEGSTNPCQSDATCGGATCEFVQVCQISGLTCEQATFFEEFDIDKDGLPDGILATLVADPANRAILTPEEWGTTTYPRCSHSQDPCVSDADCDIGVCAVSGRGCSVSADDCRSLCAIGQTECGSDQECLLADDTCTDSQACLVFETCQAGKIYVMTPDIVPTDFDTASGTLFPVFYTVQADCGSLSDPVTVVMRLWADADDNGLINIDDAFITIKGFQDEFVPMVPSRTVVAFDIDGRDCVPNQLVNISDVFLVLLAFQGERFDPNTVASNPGCSLPSCP
ncbi:MAG: hypothetical protein IIB57_11985, partial [Planctomycetes bacterium]|nr:hypothetical protein [Planctomycetota bacterium]